MIALVFGTILTGVNQLDVIVRGDASSSVPFKVAANFVVPFVVSNLGLLSGRPDRGPAERPGPSRGSR